MHKLTKRGYKSSEVPKNLWEALGIEDIPEVGTQRGEVFPILIRNQTLSEGKEALCHLINTRKGFKEPITCTQITVSRDKSEWSREKTRQHVVNETAPGLRRVFQIGQDRTPPLKVWEDARWYSILI